MTTFEAVFGLTVIERIVLFSPLQCVLLPALESEQICKKLLIQTLISSEQELEMRTLRRKIKARRGTASHIWTSIYGVSGLTLEETKCISPTVIHCNDLITPTYSPSREPRV